MGASYSVYLKPFVAGFVAYATYRWLSGSPAVSKDDGPEAKAEPSQTETSDEYAKLFQRHDKIMLEAKELNDTASDSVEEQKITSQAEAEPSDPLEDKKPVATESDSSNEVEPEVIVTLEFDNTPRLAVSPSPMSPPVLSLPVIDTDDKDCPKEKEESKPVVELKETPKELDAAEKQEKAVRTLILPSTGRAVEEIPMTDTVTSTRSWIYDTPWAPTEPLSGDRAVLFGDDVGVEPAHHMGPSLFGAPYSGGRRDVYQ